MAKKHKKDKPKVFISYSWTDKKYEDQVYNFVCQLMTDGVDVIFDKFELREGQDIYAFMEMGIFDRSVTNVLILIDPEYVKKANKRVKGVGPETLIISGEVYLKAKQDKFIPVIMRRNNKGRICKPRYLNGRKHIDLSKPETYDEMYKRLVQILYGEDSYEKPPLGGKPSWVNDKKKPSLSEREHRIYAVLKEKPNCTIDDIAKELELTPSATKYSMAKLKDTGIIVRIGSNRSGHWDVIKQKKRKD